MTPLTPASMEEIVKDDEILDREAATIAKGISSGSCSMTDFIEQLGFALTSTSVEMRVNGTKLLSSVLKQLPQDYLNVPQLSFVANFYADRLKDHHNTLPAIIDGFAAIIHMKSTDSVSIEKLLSSFFQQTTCQSQMRTDRYKLFNIFKYLHENYKDAIKEMGADYVLGLVNSIDGERDPKNLEFIFTFMPHFISNFDMFHLSEEMFEIFACYFPIDFNPSTNDPDTITRDQLADKLADCLVASQLFVDWTVSLATEKLESDLTVAKTDALELLQRAAYKFTPQSMSNCFESIWSILKPHVFPGSDNTDILNAALQLLRALLEQFSQIKETSHMQQSIVLSIILPHLVDVQQRLFQPAASIALVCVAGDAAFAAAKILNIFLLKLQALNKEPEQTHLVVEQRMKIFVNVAQIFKIATLREALKEIEPQEICQQLQQVVISNLNDNNNCNDVDLQSLALNVLAECAPIIAESERALIYRILTQLVLHASTEWLEESTQLLERLAALQPIEIQTHYLDVCIENFDTSTAFVKRKILKSILTLIRQMAFTQRILDLIFNCILNTQTTLETRLLALEALNTLMQQEDKNFIINLQHNSNIIEKLVQLRQELSTTSTLTSEADWQLRQQLSLALSMLMQHLSVPEQYIIVTQYLNELQLLKKDVDIYVAQGLLAKLHADISLDDHFAQLLHDLLQISLNKSQPQHLREVCLQLMCNLVNKAHTNTTSWSSILQSLQNLNAQLKTSEETIVAFAWFAKALIVRGANEAVEIIHALLSLLDDPQLAPFGVQAFEIITDEHKEVHLPNVKFLYKQKLFHLFMRALEPKINADLVKNCNFHYLNAYMHVLKTAPHAVLRMQMEKIGPVIFEVLEGNCQKDALKIALETCTSFVKEQDKYFAGNLQRLITSCLKLSKTVNSMHVRIAALNLLSELTKYPTYLLLPHKVDTILELTEPLDDPKRWVRRAGVTARNAWFLIGSEEI